MHGNRGYQVKRIKIAGLSVVLAALPSFAWANGVDNVRWCEMQSFTPSKGSAQSVKAPDGRPRGTRSAAALIAEARKAARAGGRNDEAIAWATLCQWPNADGASQIVRDREEVLKYLRMQF
jgi:hypothetical protein